MAEQEKSYQRVLTYLEEALEKGELGLGQSLPPERELAQRLGISRNSVREAVRLLEHMGFLVSSQGAGNFLCCNLAENLRDSFELLMLLNQADQRQLAQLRSALELQAALLAADRVTPEEAEGLKELAARLRTCPEEEGAKLDKEFHDTIAAISGNGLILQILQALSSVIDRFISDMRRRILRDPKTGMQLQYAHEQMAEALGRRDKVQLMLAVNHHFQIVNEETGK